MSPALSVWLIGLKSSLFNELASVESRLQSPAVTHMAPLVKTFGALLLARVAKQLTHPNLPDRASRLIGDFFDFGETEFRPGSHHRSALFKQIAALVSLLHFITRLMLKRLLCEHPVVSMLCSPVTEC